MKSLKKLFAMYVTACCGVLLAGCASGPRFAEAKGSIPQVSADNGRIYFYRTAVVGAAVQPTVKLNDEQIGTAQPKGFFYADRPPGNYHVDTTTEVKRRLSLTLDKGQTRYVRLNISLGFFVGHIYPELVDDPTGEKEITKCKYTGGK